MASTPKGVMGIGEAATGMVITAKNATAAHRPIRWIVIPIICTSLVGWHRYWLSKRRLFNQPDTALEAMPSEANDDKLYCRET